MADVIRMPLLSDTMTEGKITVWNKKVGDKVKSDDSLADVETDKATMEVIPYVDGTLLYIGVEAGQAAKVNAIIAIIGKEGENITALISDDGGQISRNVPEEKSKNDNQSESPKQIPIPKELTVIRMPLLSDTMTHGKIITWNKQVGDKVKADDSLADVETDKATMDVVGYTEGTLLYQGVQAGESAKVNGVIAVIGKEGFDITPYISGFQMSDSEGLGQAVGSKEVAVKSSVIIATPTPSGILTTTDNGTSLNGRVKASPLAKQIAKEKGIDLGSVQGSGDNGRIVKRDLDQAAVIAKTTVETLTQKVVPAFNSGVEGHTDMPLTQMRKIIAQRLTESYNTAPHFFLKTSVAMDALMDARKQINTVSPVKISINDMMIKACALSLASNPEVNSSWMGESIRMNHHIHIGSAIALPDGLIVPVIKFANQKSLAQIASDANELYEKARTKKIQPSEFTGNTFTISNLGMMDIDEFTAIINPPDACILAVGKIAPTAIPENGNIVVKNIMKLTLSCDHRVVDGAVGAKFLQTLKGYLENPISMLI
jgi:pyruvate dehydrogenase E2 component (dihydrolipoamide acetyltransferase)